MLHQETARTLLSQKNPLVVGAIASQDDLQLTHLECDLIELRLDSLGTGSEVHHFAENCPLPLLITARGENEGGQTSWNTEQRADAYRSLMPFATFIDIELRDLEVLHEVVVEARRENILVVGSFHDFQATPVLADLVAKFEFDADLYKFALMTNSTDDIRTHLDLLNADHSAPLSVMGMGPLGAAARPLMARSGSVLNYGYLGHTPTAPNQWPARLLKEALSI